MKRLTKELFFNFVLEKRDLQLSHSSGQSYYVLYINHYDAACIIRFSYVAIVRKTSPSDWKCKFMLSYSLNSVDYMRILSQIYSLVYSKTKGWFDLVY